MNRSDKLFLLALVMLLISGLGKQTSESLYALGGALLFAIANIFTTEK